MCSSAKGWSDSWVSRCLTPPSVGIRILKHWKADAWAALPPVALDQLMLLFAGRWFMQEMMQGFGANVALHLLFPGSSSSHHRCTWLCLWVDIPACLLLSFLGIGSEVKLVQKSTWLLKHWALQEPLVVFPAFSDVIRVCCEWRQKKVCCKRSLCRIKRLLWH